MRKLFGKIVYSEKGTNQRTKEESTYMMFLQYLDKCEKGITYFVYYGYCYCILIVSNQSGPNNCYIEIPEGDLEFTVDEGESISIDVFSFITQPMFLICIRKKLILPIKLLMSV